MLREKYPKDNDLIDDCLYRGYTAEEIRTEFLGEPKEAKT